MYTIELKCGITVNFLIKKEKGHCPFSFNCNSMLKCLIVKKAKKYYIVWIECENINLKKSNKMYFDLEHDEF